MSELISQSSRYFLLYSKWLEFEASVLLLVNDYMFRHQSVDVHTFIWQCHC